MKKLLLTISLAVVTAMSYGQGTIGFGNTIASKVVVVTSPGTAGVPLPITTRANFGAFWGTSQDALQLNNGPLGVSSDANAGILVAPATYALAGSPENGTVFLQIKGWDASFGSDWAAAKAAGALYGETDVRSVTLAGPLGPGASIWQGASGTNPNKFNPLVLSIVPEPSTIALAVLGLGSLLLFRRRK
jgi:hypothetical protein